MPAKLQPDELGFFTTLASAGSLSAAARELNISTAAVSPADRGCEERPFNWPPSAETVGSSRNFCLFQPVEPPRVAAHDRRAVGVAQSSEQRSGRDDPPASRCAATTILHRAKLRRHAY
jgi:hypothetical protein